MKRILVLLVSAALALGMASQAGAAEFSASGHFHTVFGAQHDRDFNNDTSEDTFFSRSRIRTKIDVKANEYIKGVWELQVGEWGWGGGDDYYGNRARQDSNMPEFATRLAYVTWNMPKTTASVDMGIQQITLPSATFGNPIFNSRVAGVNASGKLAEGMTLSGFWARPYLEYGVHDEGGPNEKARNVNHNSVDVFGLIANMELGAANVQPYIAYGRLGHDLFDDTGDFANSYDGGNIHYLIDGNPNDDTDLYVAGLALELKAMEALSFKFDAMYGNAKNNSSDGSGLGLENPYETDGYLMAMAIDYAMPLGTPGVFAWYSSGADKNGEGLMPVIGADGGFYPVNLAYYGATSLGNDSTIGHSGIGQWGVGLSIADMSFVERLTHSFRAAYVTGTNSKEFYNDPLDSTATGLNKKDSFIEVDFDSSYDILENWTAVLQLAYIMPSFDQKDAAGNKYYKNGGDDAFNANMYFLYDF